MTENTEQTFESIPQNVEIGVEQILASVLATVGPVVVKIDTVISNYGNYQIGVEQDEETKDLIFKLIEKDNNVQ
jgi:hypothetical protein